MKKNDFIDAVGKIDDEIIDTVSKTRKKQLKKRSRWVRITAVAACLCLLVSGILYGVGDKTSHNGLNSPVIKAYAVETASYPQMPQYPKLISDATYNVFEEQYDGWSDELRTRVNLPFESRDSFAGFVNNSLSVLFEGCDKENKVISPINIYIALSMLAETTGGESREQILSLLGEKDTEKLRDDINNLWNSCYRDDGASKTVMANSLWLDNGIEYNADTMKLLAEKYFASSFSGEMGSDDYNKAFSKWLNEQTGGLLEDYADVEKFDDTTVMALASTLLFSAKWNDEFVSSQNCDRIFHGVSKEENTEFMNESGSGSYYFADGFSAVRKDFTDFNGSMWLIRPDEGIDISELMNNAEMNKLISGKNELKSTYIKINMSVPKFDISSKTDLCENLKQLGVTDVFDSLKSDFSPAFTSSGVSLSSANHSGRIKIDEKGCEAAAFTVLEKCGEAMPPEEEVDFILDRPFIVLIQSSNNLPLFVGVINDIA